jgi:cytidyltransferase-like protein
MKKVFVSGCYDMLHSGHVAFFEEAASHGDLYVGIGSDKTVYNLKARKPFNNEQERLYMGKLRAANFLWWGRGRMSSLWRMLKMLLLLSNTT